MTTQQALDILKRHNIWRRGADIQMQSPAEIGEAIDKAVEVLSEFMPCENCGGSGGVEIGDGEYSTCPCCEETQK
jgi:hypothetical protein